MIFRISTGKARTAADVDSYAKFLETSVFPELLKISGHRCAYLLRRPVDGGEEMLIVTMWDSLDAIRSFAGEDVGAAVFEPEAQRLLPEREERVRHYDVVLQSNLSSI